MRTARSSRHQESNGSIISVRNVFKAFGEQVALDDVSVEVPHGVIVGMIGPSGCGKTTLVRNLIGVLGPDAGKVQVFGADPARFTARQRGRFGYMPQLPVLFPNLSVWGNLTFISSVYGLPVHRRKRHLLELLDLVDLADHRSKRLADCSGGMQRRLTLAATLVHEPELLYLDEPTAGVDPILRERFWSHFRTLRDQGRTIVVPTQYVGEAVSCDLVAVMAKGRVITVQPPHALPAFAYGGAPLIVPFNEGWATRADVERLLGLPFVRSIHRSEAGLIVVVDDAERGVAGLRQHALDAGLPTIDVTPHEPTFDEIFVRIIETHAPNDARTAAA